MNIIVNIVHLYTKTYTNTYNMNNVGRPRYKCRFGNAEHEEQYMAKEVGKHEPRHYDIHALFSGRCEGGERQSEWRDLVCRLAAQ